MWGGLGRLSPHASTCRPVCARALVCAYVWLRGERGLGQQPLTLRRVFLYLLDSRLVQARGISRWHGIGRGLKLSVLTQVVKECRTAAFHVLRTVLHCSLVGLDVEIWHIVRPYKAFRTKFLNNASNINFECVERIIPLCYHPNWISAQFLLVTSKSEAYVHLSHATSFDNTHVQSRRSNKQQTLLDVLLFCSDRSARM